MPRAERMRVLVTVKAYPGVGRTAGETVCVAGVRCDVHPPRWIRLWPVQFRELRPEQQFHKWQIIELEAGPSDRDRRPESYRPNLESLELGPVISSRKDWAERWQMLRDLPGATTLCALMRAQEQQPAPSLGLARVLPGAHAFVREGPVWTAEKNLLAHFAAQPNLIRERALEILNPPPYQVVYRWHCAEGSCHGHEHSTWDWEAGQAARNFMKQYGNPTSQLEQRFGRDMLGPARETFFFVGNQHQHPSSFMVLGAFYPPKGSRPPLTLFG
jgi:hypothetical protein